MVRISKQSERRSRCPRKNQNPMEKTGALQQNLPKGFKEHVNALEGKTAGLAYIPKIK